MKNAGYFFSTLSLSISLGVCAALAQDTGAARPQPAATPLDDEVVKITSNLIQLDVTVTDKNGNPVGDLKPEDFEIFENGAGKALKFFSFITPPGSSAAVFRRGGFNLDSSIPPGKYVLQITASAEKSQRTETQSIDFEVLP